jgi:glycine hydroxymethyltransferase
MIKNVRQHPLPGGSLLPIILHTYPRLYIYPIQEHFMTDFLFRGNIAEQDPDLDFLIQIEAERQYRKIILIPSESSAPQAVLQALGSVFQNLYAEGYPDEDTRWMSESEILDYEARLGHYRRYSDPRYYKGVEYADVLEALARRRCAELFATQDFSVEDLYVNVQALSGAPANNAIYNALLSPGDTIMGMDLLHGGHLTHGSPVNRSGKLYNAVHYTVDPNNEKIDYEAVEAMALEHRPKIIIAGYSSYPWAVDWERFKNIAKSAGAYLLADIAHVAGLVAAGVYPTPVGYADIISFTTHKSLCGPRGACIITHDAALARKIDRAVFPGEQGGPHMHAVAGMAVAFKMAKTTKFQEYQRQVVQNCVAFTDQLRERGLRIPYGGTDTHLMNLDCNSVKGPDGTPLSGDQAARILDLAGIVVNRNTIPGDASAANPAGIRMGTPWITQRGFKESDMHQLADIIAELLESTTPYSIAGRKGKLQRAKVDFTVLENARTRVRDMATAAGIDYEPTHSNYPHFWYIDDQIGDGEQAAFDLRGDDVRSFINYAFSSDAEDLLPGQSQPTRLYTPQGWVEGSLACLDKRAYRFTLPTAKAALAAAWLRALSDGYVAFDDDLQRKLPGPVSVTEAAPSADTTSGGNPVGERKPYYVGKLPAEGAASPLPEFQWQEPDTPLRRTPVYNIHVGLGAKVIPFAGWEMPVWYTSVMEEHQAVRQAAGLFDVAHMGVYQAEGPDAGVFLDSVVGNVVSSQAVGDSLYTHFLSPNAEVIDDLMVYRRDVEKFLVVVNASNDDKDWAWLNAVKDGQVMVDLDNPVARAFGRDARLRNLRDPQEGADMRVDIALQGPRSRDILLALGCDEETQGKIKSLKRTQLCDAVVGGFDLVVSRTGYTGERMAFELFIHPERADELFNRLLEAGEPFGLKPCGLGARDSLRTEAGLPLYGHEMGGEHSLGVGEGGFGAYVKTYKPWFIGRQAFIEREAARKSEVVRFRFTEKGVRMAHPSDPVLDKRGRVIGWVTSCAVDSEGYLTGQAYVDLKNSAEGTPLFIYQSAPKEAGKPPAELKLGDRGLLPTLALVVSRFKK